MREQPSTFIGRISSIDPPLVSEPPAPQNLPPSESSNGAASVAPPTSTVVESVATGPQSPQERQRKFPRLSKPTSSLSQRWQARDRSDKVDRPSAPRRPPLLPTIKIADSTFSITKTKKRPLTSAEEALIESTRNNATRPDSNGVSHKDSPAKRARRSLQLENRIDLEDLRALSRRPNEPPSPLFFSNHLRQRPPLPPRFSSAEAGVRMLEKADMEDAAPVRTVKMARGSIHLGSSPHRAASTPSARIVVDRASPGGLTPEEKQAASSGLASLGKIDVLEMLDHDDRATIVIDLSNRSLYQPGVLQTVFANQALRAYPSLLDILCGRFKEDESTLLASAATFPEFKSWATSFVKEFAAMDVALPAFVYAGVTWTASTLQKRFRLIRGAVLLNAGALASDTASALTTGTSNGLEIIDKFQRKRRELAMEEPHDYFGNIDAALMNDASSDGSRIKSIVPSIETPNTPNKALLASTNHARTSSNSALPHASPLKPPSPLGARVTEAPLLRASSTGIVDVLAAAGETTEHSSFDWTRIPIHPGLPKHIQFARSVDWASTALGPINNWSLTLRAMCNLIMASPNPAAMYWGDEYVALYNEPYILLAGQKHPYLMGTPYSVAWPEIWDDVKDSFTTAKVTGQATMKDDDRLFLNRSGFLEETYFSWSIIPLLGEDGKVEGLYNPAFEKTRRKIAERRMLTLREVGERTAHAREVRSFWGEVLKGLEDNEYDTPFVLLYSVAEEWDSDESSIHSNSIATARACKLEGTLPALPEDHPAAPRTIDLKAGTEGFASKFREAMTRDRPILLETSTGELDPKLLEGIDFRGFKEAPRAAVVCPIHPTTGDSIIGFLLMGINPRRPYDDDYNLFVQLLGRQLATSMASVVLFEEEIRRGQRAAKLAALDRIELSEQLAARTQEAVESETKFTRMAEFAPVGVFIADGRGQLSFSNDAFHDISKVPKGDETQRWMEAVLAADRPELDSKWSALINECEPMSLEFRFKAPWYDRDGQRQDNWVLASAYPEKNDYGTLKTVFGILTNISQQKWAEGYQRRRMEEAVELKRQQTNFMDMTSHEMRNPLSAILQCADEIAESLADFKISPGKYNLPVDLIDNNIDAAQTIALCANHQTRIVSDVLTLSKLDSALLLVTPVDARPATIVQQALKMFDGELQTADIKMKFVIDKSFEELNINWVRLDPSRLLQVLINLTTNAIKFTTTQAKRTIIITMSATKTPPSLDKRASVDYIPSRNAKKEVAEGKDWGDGEALYLLFSVQDTGKGLTESEKKLLFLRFSQASPKTHVQYGGSGLGLFISRELVELQGGEIGVSSVSGKGSTFAFYVKARRSEGPKDEEDSFRPTGGLRKSSMNRPSKASMSLRPAKATDIIASGGLAMDQLKVLIVEDNLVNQKVLSKQLRNLGCTVHVANHGGECIELLQRTKYWAGNEQDGLDLSVILMDLEMPVMDGLTCTRKIREYQKDGSVVAHIPIVAVSANARDAHVEGALAAGMDDVVSKPFRIPELLPKIELLLDRYNRQQSSTPSVLSRTPSMN